LPNVIDNSIIGEKHPDYLKKDGIRDSENEINPDVNIYRLYGSVMIDGNYYRIKTTLKEYNNKNMKSKPHSYEVTNIELLEGTTAPIQKSLTTAEQTNGNIGNATKGGLSTSNKSISAAKLLKGVEKSYEKGKYILNDHSNAIDANGEPLASAVESYRLSDAFGVSDEDLEEIINKCK
jgi:hypothetical protein